MSWIIWNTVWVVILLLSVYITAEKYGSEYPGTDAGHIDADSQSEDTHGTNSERFIMQKSGKERENKRLLRHKTKLQLTNKNH